MQGSDVSVNSTLEDLWREVSPYLDEVLQLEGEPRQRWLAALEARKPATAAALRGWLAELNQLEERKFFAGGATWILVSHAKSSRRSFAPRAWPTSWAIRR